MLTLSGISSKTLLLTIPASASRYGLGFYSRSNAIGRPEAGASF